MVILILFISPFGYSNTVTSMQELMKPELIRVQGDDMVIVEGATVSIYSLKNNKLIKKFGTLGEGPQEFKLLPGGFGLEVTIFPDFVFVNSIGKISYYTRQGEFIKEKKVNSLGRMTPFGDNFVGNSLVAGKSQGPEMGFNLFDQEGNKSKELCSLPMPVFKGKNATLLDMISKVIPQYQTAGDRVYVAGKKGLEINIYDKEGNAVGSLKHNVPLLKLSAGEKKELFNAYAIHPLYKLFWDAVKDAVVISDEFPAYKVMVVEQSRIYVQTFTRKNNTTQFLIFDLNGKFIKSVFLPLAFENIMTPFPFTIDGNNLYQLVEDVAADSWQLHITQIK